MCGGPKMPQAPAEPVAPAERTDTEVNDAAEKERKRRRAMTGRSSTILTQSSGVGESPETAYKSLMGA